MDRDFYKLGVRRFECPICKTPVIDDPDSDKGATAATLSAFKQMSEKIFREKWFQAPGTSVWITFETIICCGFCVFERD
jgi:hypothetical protein